ncbi:hypothetical protein GSI_07638 [Ganoderma sinense ZZ0214-1]|uniref:Uncharacterized protein n=1 Tax=Ganoderma sinense ZZ0214-1 TaxID=1077348 RepID=A0A2G8S8H1_9APHY|nr:hypothetical protein GSI_07638 [Ganoderma sinense ZZ0214-1]
MRQATRIGKGDLATMQSRWGKDRLRLALRTPTSPSVPSPTLNMGTFSLNHPSSLTECVPTNITWTGGAAPYSLQINWGASSTTIRQFNNILDTNFVWDTDVAAGTPVSFQVLDARTVQVALDPIVVGVGPNSTCVQDGILLPPSASLSATPISIPSSYTYTRLITSSGSLIPSTVVLPTPSFVTTTSRIPLASATSPVWYTDRQTATQRVSLNGASTAGLVVGLVSLLTFAVWLWSRYQQSRARKRSNDAEQQDRAGGGDKFEAGIALWGDDDSTTTSEDQPEDVPTPNPSNEIPSVPSEDQAPIPPPTAPVSVPEDQPSSTTPSAPIQPNTPKFFSSRRTKRLQRPRFFSPTQSDTGTLSDTGAARLSSSTASGSTSTAPPSYRTRRSSVYAAPPPLPPPAYTPANLPPPPLAFRMPRRARRGWLPTSSKLAPASGQENASASPSVGVSESASVRPLPGATGSTTENGAEGTGMDAGVGEMLVERSFSDSKREPPGESARGERLTFADTADSGVSETGATIRSAGRED